MNALVSLAATCLFAMGGWFSSSPDVARCILVTDDAGKPLANAVVDVRWWYSADSVHGAKLEPTLKLDKASLTTDRDGLCRFSHPQDLVNQPEITRVALPGYVPLGFAARLGASYTRQGVDGNPHRLMLRPRAAETDLPLLLDFSFEGTATRAEAAAGAKSFDINLFANARRKLGPDYVDFSVTPRYDEARKSWSVVFSTTNAQCGIVASTRSLFVAPETGYAPRVEVSEADLRAPGGTLYLRTRDPLVYAMVPMAFFGPAPKGETVRFACYSPRVNLWGGRVFEADPDVEEDDLLNTLDPRPLLDEHRYPLRPETPLVLEKMRAVNALWAEIENADADLREKERRIDEILRKVRARGTYSPELAALERDKAVQTLERSVLFNKYWELDKELWASANPDSAARRIQDAEEVEAAKRARAQKHPSTPELLRSITQTRARPPRSVQHLLVVDEGGKPLPGARVSLAWQVVDQKTGERTPMSTHYATDAAGRIMVNYDPAQMAEMSVKTVDLTGYAFEKAHNPDLRLPAFDQPLGSDGQPIRLVLRQIASRP